MTVPHWWILLSHHVWMHMCARKLSACASFQVAISWSHHLSAWHPLQPVKLQRKWDWGVRAKSRPCWARSQQLFAWPELNIKHVAYPRIAFCHFQRLQAGIKEVYKKNTSGVNPVHFIVAVTFPTCCAVPSGEANKWLCHALNVAYLSKGMKRRRSPERWNEKGKDREGGLEGVGISPSRYNKESSFCARDIGNVKVTGHINNESHCPVNCERSPRREHE